MPAKKTTAQFIEDARKVHGDKYDYSLVEYVNSKAKVKIVCQEHGPFLLPPNAHISQKQGCKKCGLIKNGLSSRLSTQSFIERAILKHGDRFDYSKVVYTTSNAKVEIICKVHGPFIQGANSHLGGRGCSKCSGQYQPSTEEFIQRAKAAHGDRYDYSKVKYVGNKLKVKIICKEHGVFTQTPKSHCKRDGCPDCSKNKKGTVLDFINRAKKVHGERYDYSKTVYANAAIKVEIVCKEHGAFKTHVHSHLKGRGCQKCSMIEYVKKRSLSQDEFLRRSNIAHGDRFDYSLTEYTSSSSKVIITCKVHGPFLQWPGDHMKGIGCSKCSDVFKGDYNRLSNDDFIKKAQLKHNNRYGYSQTEYQQGKKKVKITCLIHGVFLQSPNDHLGGAGCPKCSASKGELRIEEYLKTTDLLFEAEKRFENCRNRYTLPFDFYIPSHNLLIEYDGEQHFKVIGHFGIESFRRTQKHDQIKNRFAERHNIRLLRIKYTEYDRIEEILSEALKLEYQPLQLSLFAA
jgi:very-short-patch-repair endonuclease